MKINIRDLMENIEDSSVDLEETNVVSSERIKELTKMKINELGAAPKRKSKKTIITVLIAVAVVSALGITTFAAINGGLASRTFGKSTWAPEDETYVDSDGEEYTFTDQDKLVLGGEFIIKNLNTNKVTVIMEEIGVQPVLSFGNSTGDAAMAEFVTSNNPYKSLAFMLCCDDTERENGNVSKADKMKDLCDEYGWVPVSMKNDWTTIYGEGVKRK